ncbi:Elongator subunit elp4 [Saitoella coloradoensis]
MSFQRRRLPVNVSSTLPSGVRPSALNGTLTTSTGCLSLDAVLNGLGGLPLGSSLLVLESGTTDFSGSLARYFAAEGVLQGHGVCSVGVGEAWISELPGQVGADKKEKKEKAEGERMQIAWRYNNMGEFGTGIKERVRTTSTAKEKEEEEVYCHAYDLTKRLSIPPSAIPNITHTPPPLSHFPPKSNTNPYTPIIAHIAKLLSTPPAILHRVVIPNLLNPTLYPPHTTRPEHLLRFFHSLRVLLRTYPTRLVVLLTLPLDLYPRETGLVRVIEHYVDAVVELAPFPRPPPSTTNVDVPQGLVRVHKVPGSGAGGGEGGDLAFRVTRKNFYIEAFVLPVVVEEEEGRMKKDIEF